MLHLHIGTRDKDCHYKRTLESKHNRLTQVREMICTVLDGETNNEVHLANGVSQWVSLPANNCICTQIIILMLRVH